MLALAPNLFATYTYTQPATLATGIDDPAASLALTVGFAVFTLAL